MFCSQNLKCLSKMAGAIRRIEKIDGSAHAFDGYFRPEKDDLSYTESHSLCTVLASQAHGTQGHLQPSSCNKAFTSGRPVLSKSTPLTRGNPIIRVPAERVGEPVVLSWWGYTPLHHGGWDRVSVRAVRSAQGKLTDDGILFTLQHFTGHWKRIRFSRCRHYKRQLHSALDLGGRTKCVETPGGPTSLKTLVMGAHSDAAC